MLLGEFPCTIDAHHRLIIPEAFRAALSSGLVITRGLERCLLIYPVAAWQQLTGSLQERLRLTRPADRALARLLFAGAWSGIPDAQGSLFLPANLRDYADLLTEAVMIGLYDHLELWKSQHWATITAQMRTGYAELQDSFPLI